MLTWEDCLGVADLTAEEVAAIAVHEHLPQMLALELGNHLCQRPDGAQRIRRMIQDDIEAAWLRGDQAEATRLERVLARFCRTHPLPTAAPVRRAPPERGSRSRWR
jgi:predicted component of type VI protein secretion system